MGTQIILASNPTLFINHFSDEILAYHESDPDSIPTSSRAMDAANFALMGTWIVAFSRPPAEDDEIALSVAPPNQWWGPTGQGVGLAHELPGFEICRRTTATPRPLSLCINRINRL